MEKNRTRIIVYFLALAAAVLLTLTAGCRAEAAGDTGQNSAGVSAEGSPSDAADQSADVSGSAEDAEAGSAEDARSAVRTLIVDDLRALYKIGKEVEYTRITRKEVYRLRPGSRVSRKDLRTRGGYRRWFQIYKIREGDRVYKRIAGRTYRLGGVVSLSSLRYIRTLYYDFSGKVRSGEIIVNKSIADDALSVFRELYRARYQIAKMHLVDDYFRDSGSGPATWSNQAATDADTASMNDDNTSGFNYRTVAGTGSISMHGYGRAIDVNPFENPWCPGGSVYYNQRESASYADRGNRRDHMIYADSKITKIFRKHGFRWLGETAARDYQHFEK